MKKILLFTVLLLIFIINVNTQVKTNSIVFAELLAGYSNGGYKGLTCEVTVNYQCKNNLFTFRNLELNNYKKVGTYIIIPNYILVKRVREY